MSQPNRALNIIGVVLTLISLVPWWLLGQLGWPAVGDGLAPLLTTSGWLILIGLLAGALGLSLIAERLLADYPPFPRRALLVALIVGAFAIGAAMA